MSLLASLLRTACHGLGVLVLAAVFVLADLLPTDARAAQESRPRRSPRRPVSDVLDEEEVEEERGE